MPDLVEVVLVQLADKAGEIAVLKVLWQDGLGEPLVLGVKSDRAVDTRSLFQSHLQHDKAIPFVTPSHDLGV